MFKVAKEGGSVGIKVRSRPNYYRNHLRWWGVDLFD